ncbi:hypothetical protein [Persicobacter diffluens]|uniref:Uncharacterized protein n=1 Tax=Persicobacter diffluens TaxID=981 RepID=A0AAN4W3K1_9BACT|nr:hypothetical protein PEDI_46030 [Persicobacter diffluens]
MKKYIYIIVIGFILDQGYNMVLLNLHLVGNKEWEATTGYFHASSRISSLRYKIGEKYYERDIRSSRSRDGFWVIYKKDDPLYSVYMTKGEFTPVGSNLSFEFTFKHSLYLNSWGVKGKKLSEKEFYEDLVRY